MRTLCRTWSTQQATFLLARGFSAVGLPLSHVFERTAMYMYLHHVMAIYYGESLDRIGVNLRECGPRSSSACHAS
jgi:hypothetical protein